jgi:hypothetical protein
VRSALNTFNQEVSVISDDYYKGVASEEGKSEAKDLFFSDIRSELSMQAYSYFANLSDDSLEAYLLDVAEDYFIYELIDYNKPYPESVSTYKSPYTITEDGKVVADLSNMVELERVWVEKSSAQEINTDKEVIPEMAKETQSQASEEVVVAPEVAELEAKASSFEAKASELQGQVDSLTEELRIANEAKASLETEVVSLKSQLDEIKATKVAEARLAELTGLGITLSEARQAKLKGMSDEDYADFKELLVEVAGNKAEATKEEVVEEEVVEKSEASEEEVEEEIVVEGAIKASAGLNIEQEAPKTVKPFGHLSL